jgi:hypothetical protein
MYATLPDHDANGIQMVPLTWTLSSVDPPRTAANLRVVSKFKQVCDRFKHVLGAASCRQLDSCDCGLANLLQHHLFAQSTPVCYEILSYKRYFNNRCMVKGFLLLSSDS